IAAGAQHSFALKSDGSLWAWGQNFYGALGDGTTTDRRTPVQARGLSGIVAIAAGGQHGLARKSDGSVWTWGWNDYGQLGREAIRALDYDRTVRPGAAKSSHRIYTMSNTGFPWVQFDENLHKILLHPGESGTSQWAASLGFNVTADDQYTISGVFQRASGSHGSRYEVDVAIILDTDAAHPLWDEHIDPRDRSKKIFYIRKRLLRGQVIRFVVFNGSEGKDGTVEDTSIEATIER
ncbi:MAG TPA: hypothetical protein VLX58_11490, partial [Bryobacteraceae bacterium]|nr:hypothetical protein [Bryobacteraceae bacterium]